ncbi:MAG TPA: SagB/ThcOx family dehydrogenase [Usitatibacter sp.]|nr:SagB/ThcOx family dehydrogenase [Usitatibacter sp.]
MGAYAIPEGRTALLEYHSRSKHRLNRYAAGPGRLDWANQPAPFREFAQARHFPLGFEADALATRYGDLRRGLLPTARAFSRETVAILLQLSLGLSAWKVHGSSRWALRCNPSSGNLHPTEAYVACPSLGGLTAGVYHYVSRDHVLEQRAVIVEREWSEAFHGSGFFVGLSSIHWREAWKYGMRAWRYCQHDAGHAIAALSYAAAALGWSTRIAEGFSDEDVAAILGVDRLEDFQGAEAETPDVLLWIGDPAAMPRPQALVATAHRGRWQGHANRLSARHVEWPDIDAIHLATLKPRTAPTAFPRNERPATTGEPRLDLSFAAIARQRRSAVDFGGFTRMAAETFFAMLEPLMPSAHAPPWNVLEGPAAVHPLFMVHRVEGLEPGLYVQLREEHAREALERSMKRDWLWERRGPAHMSLYFLLPYDLRDVAQLICCHQDIASNACFALGMLADFGAALEEPWRYRRLFRECGMLGQVLYLEAEAAGLRATGVGCYFDDEMHHLAGLRDEAWQSLYHFTVGAPVEDERLTTLPPYPA